VCRDCVKRAYEQESARESAAKSSKWPVPERYAEAVLDSVPTPQHRRQYDALRKFGYWIAHRDPRGGRIVYLDGVRGVGKTHAACAVLNVARKAGFSIAFCPANLLFEQLRAGLRYDTDREHTTDSLLEALGLVDVLCLDDLGMEADNDRASSLLYAAVGERYNKRKATLITSNIPIHELAQDARALALADRAVEDDLRLTFPPVNLRNPDKGKPKDLFKGEKQ